MTNEWDQYADGWDTNTAVIEFSEKALASLTNVVAPDGLTILDFGCGTGLLTEKLASRAKQVVALDSSTEMLKVLQQKELANVSIVNGLLTADLLAESPVLQEKFDLIVASSVCGFLPNYPEIVALFRSMLKLDGLFIQWDWLTEDADVEYGMSIKTIATTFDNVGLTTVALREEFSLAGPEGTMPVVMAVGRNP